MATPIHIPPRYLSGLQAVASLSLEDTARICTAFDEAPRRLTLVRLAGHLQDALPDLEYDAEQILEAVLSLVALLPEDASGAKELAEDVSASRDLELSDTARRDLAVHLESLMTVRPLYLAARASSVVLDYDRAFHDARVLTDVRPVFGPVVDDGPQAAAIISTLKLEFHPAGDRGIESSFYALDRMDLVRLRQVVDRAIRKTDQLEKLLNDSDLPYWEFREPRDAADR